MAHTSRRLALAALLAGFAITGCMQSGPTRPEDANNPSPTAGSDSSKTANEMADKAMYKPVEYQNAKIKGPTLVVIPGEIKSNNATFTQKFSSNNIADFVELELSNANFGVLERSDMGPMMKEFQLAYTMGDPNAARKVLQKGKWKTTKWVVKFDIIKAEQVAQAKEGFDGAAAGQMIGILAGSRGGAAAGVAVGSVKTEEATGVWIIGMRFKVLNANTTEQVATGYTEQKMEVGSKSTSVMGVSKGAQGGLTLDGMVQRLVQALVWEIDAKHKVAATPPRRPKNPPPARLKRNLRTKRITPCRCRKSSASMKSAASWVAAPWAWCMRAGIRALPDASPSRPSGATNSIVPRRVKFWPASSVRRRRPGGSLTRISWQSTNMAKKLTARRSSPWSSSKAAS